ncbi:hypothetical protein B0H13DRAFT_2674495, partial [Mycena leptocephala]
EAVQYGLEGCILLLPCQSATRQIPRWPVSVWVKTCREILISSLLNPRQTQQRQSHTGQIPASRADERSPHLNVSKDSNPPRYSSSKPLG